MNLSKENSNFLKLVGVISMCIDHIGKFFFPQYVIFQIIGRIAFPIFAFQLTIGYQKTSNKKRYIQRLLIFAFISQPIFYLATKKLELNILFALALGFWALSSWEKKKYYHFAFILPLSLFVEYKIYGILMIVGFFVVKQCLYQTLYFGLNNLVYILLWKIPLFQFYSLLALLFVYKLNFVRVKLPKYFFYIFYPGHLLVIYLIKVFFF